jgi:TRAP-type uncharacterized transport system fused permease subunit
MIGIGIATAPAGIIAVPSLLAQVVVSLGQQNGLIVPLIAVHLFVFYFGIMADVTPPVGSPPSQPPPSPEEIRSARAL